MELETIYKEWEDNRRRWREHKVSTLSDKEKKSAKLHLEGFADQTMDTFQCFVYGFKGLMQQYEREFQGKRGATNVPSQMRLEGHFGITRQQGPRTHMTPDDYSRILSRIQQLKLSQQVVNSTNEHSIGDVPEVMDAIWSPQTHHGVRTVNPFASARSADCAVGATAVVAVGGNGAADDEPDEVKQVVSLLKPLQSRLVAGGTFVDDASKAMQAIIKDRGKCKRVLEFVACLREETEAAFHHFVHLIAKGKQMQVLWYQTEWDRRAVQFQQFNVDNLITHRRKRWNAHVWGPTIGSVRAIP